MKRIFSLILLSVSLLGLSSCQGKDDPLGIHVLVKERTFYDFFDKSIKSYVLTKGYYLTVNYSSNPNQELNDKNDVFGNLYQDVPALLEDNKSNNFKLSPVFGIGHEILGIYSLTSTLETIREDGANFVLPEEKNLLGRSLHLLQEQGIIELDENVGIDGDLQSIRSNPKNINFHVLPITWIYYNLGLYDYGMMYASAPIQNKNEEDPSALTPLAIENTSSVLMEEYGLKHNVIFAVKNKDFADPRITILKEAFRSPAFNSFLTDTLQSGFHYRFLDNPFLYKE